MKVVKYINPPKDDTVIGPQTSEWDKIQDSFCFVVSRRELMLGVLPKCTSHAYSFMTVREVQNT